MAMTPQEEARRKAEEIWPTEDETSQIIRANNYKFKLGFVRGYTADRWVDCKVRLPEEKKNVLFAAHGACYIGNYSMSEELWYSSAFTYGVSSGVTHWQPLPEPPKANEG